MQMAPIKHAAPKAPCQEQLLALLSSIAPDRKYTTRPDGMLPRVMEMSALGQKRTFHRELKGGFDALKMYRLLLKKYLFASLNCSNSPCQFSRSSAETSFLPPTNFRTICANPQL